MSPQQRQAGDVGHQRDDADGGDPVRPGHGAADQLAAALREDDDPERRHEAALEECAPRLPAWPTAHDVEAEAVDDRVAQHVDGVREQPRGVGQQAGETLRHEHRGVDDEDEDQDPALPRLDDVDLAALIHGLAEQYEAWRHRAHGVSAVPFGTAPDIAWSAGRSAPRTA